MKAENIIWDIKEILKATNRDSDIEDLHLLHKINSYRSVMIRTEYEISRQINPIWLQNSEPISLTTKDFSGLNGVDSGINVSYGSLPKALSLPGNIGYYRITGLAKHKSLAKISIEELSLKIELNESIPDGYGYCCIIGTEIMVWPIIDQIVPLMIFENPLDCKIYNGTTWTARTILDDYPLDMTIAQNVVLSILTKDMQISAQQIKDVVNNNQQDLYLMKNAFHE